MAWSSCFETEPSWWRSRTCRRCGARTWRRAAPWETCWKSATWTGAPPRPQLRSRRRDLLLERGGAGVDDLLQVVGLAEELDGVVGADQLLQGALVGGGDHERAALHHLRVPHQPQEGPVRIVGRRDVVDDDVGLVLLDVLDQVEPPALESVDVGDHRLESRLLEGLANQLQDFRVGVEDGDDPRRFLHAPL